MSVKIGDLLKDRYKIDALLGQGAMGAVFRASDTLPHVPISVALKEFRLGDLPTGDQTRLHQEPDTTRTHSNQKRPSTFTREKAVEQFKREAQILYEFHHPNLPRVTDWFREGDEYYLVMELIEGLDLDTKQVQNGDRPFAKRQVFAWLSQVLDALEYCHSQGIVHRDIKPANIIVTPDGKAYLVDFGISRLAEVGNMTLVRGRTSGFSPLEQYTRRGQIDERSDIYALGATIYDLLTGQPPEDAVERVAGSKLVLPRTINASISTQTEAVIIKALAIKPEDRYQNIGEFRAAMKVHGTNSSKRKKVVNNEDASLSEPEEKQPNALNKQEITKSPYKILDVSRGAGQESVEASYRSLVSKFKPERGASPETVVELREINWAYGILSDPDKLAEWNLKHPRKSTPKLSSEREASQDNDFASVNELRTPPVIKQAEPSINSRMLPVNELHTPPVMKPPPQNLMEEGSRRTKNSSNGKTWLFAIGGFFIFVFILFLGVGKMNGLLTPPPTLTYRPSKTPLPSLTRLPLTVLMVTPTSTLSHCRLWSSFNDSDVGKQRCVYGRIVKIYQTEQYVQIIRFSINAGTFLIWDRNDFVDVSINDCIAAEGIILKDASSLYMDIVGTTFYDFSGCP
jgi:serine/threonine protein kinase